MAVRKHFNMFRATYATECLHYAESTSPTHTYIDQGQNQDDTRQRQRTVLNIDARYSLINLEIYFIVSCSKNYIIHNLNGIILNKVLFGNNV